MVLSNTTENSGYRHIFVASGYNKTISDLHLHKSNNTIFIVLYNVIINISNSCPTKTNAN